MKRKSAKQAPAPDALPPHSSEAEQGVLGCLLLSPDNTFPEIANQLTPEAFYDLRHRTIYELLVEMRGAGTAIDMITVQQRLKDRQLLEAVGGLPYVASLPDEVPSSANLDYYLDILLDKARRRADAQTAAKLTALAGDEKLTPEQYNAVRASLVKPTQGASSIEPWSDPVEGAALLKGLKEQFERFLVLPDYGAGVLALWTLHTYAWHLAEYTPLLAFTSPIPGCGKSRGLDVLERLAARSFRSNNVTEAVVFRVVAERKPTLLVDELDSIGEEARNGICNLLNGGFHRSGRVHRVEGERKRQVVEFESFCPQAVACVKLATLPRATVSRAIILRMQRKARGQKVERLRKYDGSEWQRKSARWVADHKTRLEGATAVLTDALDDRQQDVWEPLAAIADLCGGSWPQYVRDAALALCGHGGDEREDGALALLEWVRQYFNETHTDRVTSKDLCAWLNEQAEAGFKDWRGGKGIDARSLARMLAGFEVRPGSIRVAGDKATFKGFYLTQFADAFTSYLSDLSASDRHTGTKPASIGGNGHFVSGTKETCAGREKTSKPAPVLGCAVVPDQTHENDTDL